MSGWQGSLTYIKSHAFICCTHTETQLQVLIWKQKVEIFLSGRGEEKQNERLQQYNFQRYFYTQCVESGLRHKWCKTFSSFKHEKCDVQSKDCKVYKLSCSVKIAHEKPQEIAYKTIISNLGVGTPTTRRREEVHKMSWIHRKRTFERATSQTSISYPSLIASYDTRRTRWGYSHTPPTQGRNIAINMIDYIKAFLMDRDLLVVSLLGQ